MNPADTNDKFRAILVFFAFVGTVVFNVLATMGYVSGVTPKMVSAKYETVLTPAGYAFSIWSLIYLGLAGFSVYQMLRANIGKFRQVRTLFIGSCVLNCGWIYFWHQERIAVCLAIILALAAVVGMITYHLRGPWSFKAALLTSVPFGLYFGWVSCAALVNLMVWLQYSGIVSLSTVNAVGIVLMVVAAIFAVLVRWRISNFIYPLAVAWALTAIGVKQSGNTAVVLVSALCTMVALITTGSVVTHLKDATSE